MEWSEPAIVLATRPYGETSIIASVLTRGVGRHAGMVRGGTGRRAAGTWQPGNRVMAQWRARLADQLGQMTAELERGYAGAVLHRPDRLAALAAACALVEAVLPEREPHPDLYDALDGLLNVLAVLPTGGADAGRADWGGVYVRWELGLLSTLGYGLDLSACAATGVNDDLTWVSPRTGRAVSASAGEPYRDRLLVLPAFLLSARGRPAGTAEVVAGLALTGHFLDRRVLGPVDKALPAARTRLVGLFDG